MAYCTVTDIEQYSNDTYNTESRPTLTAVEGMISNHEGTINAILDTNGITPPTTGYGFTYLKLTNIYCTMADVCRTNNVESEAYKEYSRLCSDNLKELKDNPAIVDSDISSGGASGSEKEDVKYIWDEQQWGS